MSKALVSIPLPKKSPQSRNFQKGHQGSDKGHPAQAVMVPGNGIP
ncbi:MAG: hypothetical protein RIM83_05305 [Allomuricauda sp.]